MNYAQYALVSSAVLNVNVGTARIGQQSNGGKFGRTLIS